MARNDDFHRDVSLPPGLTLNAIKHSIDYTERELVDLVELYFEQANVFSAVVGIFGTRAIDQHSVYEKVRHTDISQTRFPDLRHRNSGPNPAPRHCLESKASKRAWAIQSHYNHEGWYIVWRYLVDPTERICEGRPVIIWRVDIAYLTKDDWKYEGSTARQGRGGRTHTFSVIRPATRLQGCQVYQRSDIRLISGKPIHEPLHNSG
jgi:hypothetical protein